ncbi:MAG: FHA domain-containing protein [Pirellulaceae bacterium]|jgi:pSer/pThr/pTyr-binding forkhead associated (FHA) protein|nr:FHA domain-containing protein [Pirellulaceae bacterium]
MPDVQLNEFPLVVGRTDDADLTISDRWVSRRHCVFNWTDGSLHVRDLDSKHGTYVNNQPIDDVQLKAGDRVAIGMSTFVVSYEAVMAEQG